MFSIFRDDSYPNIRRSIATVAATICFVCAYGIELKLPKAVFGVSSGATKIPIATSLILLWVLLGYLLVRFGFHFRESWIRYTSRLDQYSEVKEEADHYAKQLEKLRKGLAQDRNAIAAEVDEVQNAVNRIKSVEDDLKVGLQQAEQHIELLNQFLERADIEAPYQGRKLAILERDRELTEQDFGLLRSIHDDFGRGIRRLVGGVEFIENRTFEKPEIKNHENRLSAEGLSASLLGRDVLFSSVLVFGSVGFALYQTIHWYF